VVVFTAFRLKPESWLTGFNFTPVAGKHNHLSPGTNLIGGQQNYNYVECRIILFFLTPAKLTITL